MASLSFEAVESHYGLIGVTPSDVPLGRVVEVAVEGLGGLLLRFLKRDAGEFGTHVVERDRGQRQGVTPMPGSTTARAGAAAAAPHTPTGMPVALPASAISLIARNTAGCHAVW